MFHSPVEDQRYTIEIKEDGKSGRERIEMTINGKLNFIKKLFLSYNYFVVPLILKFLFYHA